MDIKRVGPKKSMKKGAPKQSFYKPVNIDKYVGDHGRIISRSSWERKFCIYCDKNDHVLKWASEPFSIKYIDPIENRTREYFIDFWVKIQNADNTTSEYLVEVKQEGKLKKPEKPTGKSTAKLTTYNRDLREYIINMAKKQYAEIYAKNRGAEYMYVTEKFLFQLNGKS
jgi:hypothetical protein